MSKTTTPTPAPEKSVSKNEHQFLFARENYILMFTGLAVIILGYILMAGGKSADPNVFDESSLYSTVRITIAPILVLLGLAIEGYAIMKTPKA